MKTSRRGLNRVLLNIYDGVLLETSEMLLVVDWIKYYPALLDRTASEVSAFVFSVFGLNIERCGVSLRIQSECGKIRTRKTSNTDIFHPVSDISFFSSPPWFHFSAEFILKHLPLDYSNDNCTDYSSFGEKQCNNYINNIEVATRKIT